MERLKVGDSFGDRDGETLHVRKLTRQGILVAGEFTPEQLRKIARVVALLHPIFSDPDGMSSFFRNPDAVDSELIRSRNRGQYYVQQVSVITNNAQVDLEPELWQQVAAGLNTLADTIVKPVLKDGDFEATRDKPKFIKQCPFSGYARAWHEAARMGMTLAKTPQDKPQSV